MESNQELIRIKSILLRRKWWLALPLLATVLLTGIICVLLPNTYKSTATVLIQNQQIPAALVPSTITSYAQERIQSISQEVTSRSKLLNLVQKYDLLPEDRKKLTTEDLVEKIRKRVSLQTINAEINTERGQNIQMAIAFALSYEDESPKKAQAVTNEIASFYLEKNAESRAKHARGTTEFLDEQLKLEKARIDDLQSRLAVYQNAHLEELPEYSSLNMQKLEKLNGSISDINMQMRSLQEQHSSLKASMAMLDPYGGGAAGKVMSSSERLQQAQLELANILSRYSESHPAVQAKKQEIDLLEADPAGREVTGEAASQLAELEGKLAALRSKYSEQHPDVQNTLREIERVTRESREAGPRGSVRARSRNTDRATNPAYVGLQAELNKIDITVSALKAEKKRVEGQLKEVYEKLHAMPQVAKEYMDIQTELGIARTHYNEIQQKLLAAKVSQGMEEEQLGESFAVIEPAFMPEKPFKPNRLAIMLIGVVLGAGFSVGATALKELTDRSVRDAATLEGLTDLRVMSVIPHILTAEDLAMQRRRRVLAATSCVGCLVVGILVFHFLIMDLDVFAAKFERLVSRQMP